MQLSEQDEIAIELEEWIQSFDAVVEHSGGKSATNILHALDRRAKELGLIHEAPKFSPYQNTIPIGEQPKYPGNSKLEEKIIQSRPHAEFIKCLDTTCRTTGIEMKNAEFYLHETIDKENPKWEKMVLDIKFVEEDFDDKLEKWEKIRDKIDASILKLKHEQPLLVEIIELEKTFFINMVF